MLLFLILLLLNRIVQAFLSPNSPTCFHPFRSLHRHKLPSTPPDENGNENEYEIFDYENSEYELDQGLSSDSDSLPLSSTVDKTDDEIEEMREERRIRNDQFQFEKFFETVSGDWRGAWDVYDVVFNSGPLDFPIIQKAKPLRVLSEISRTTVDADRSLIESFDYLTCSEVVLSEDENFGDSIDDGFGEAKKTSNDEPDLKFASSTSSTYPSKLTQRDFRGVQGNMLVANVWTVCSTEPPNVITGPYEKLNIEVGIRYGEIRLKLKLNYVESNSLLKISRVVVCRDRLDKWPTRREKPFFGPQGAPGGIFDLPPIQDAVSDKMLAFDFDGYATALFPSEMTQKEVGEGVKTKDQFVVTLDWSPGKMRYQVDRKFFGGELVKGLRTLELSEVLSTEAEKYSPGKPGDMKQ
ncbi:hypothetical protein ScalyP_jg2793 [Parmales sp. scaly parma]|nr:hypothetical protein ScalyP_jg2793 [Parmales sp. scaly parma]